MARRKLSHPRIGRGSVGRAMTLPAQYGAGAKTTAPTSGHSGGYPSTGRTAPHNVETSRRTGRYPN
jgi:hypothetical protein